MLIVQIVQIAQTCATVFETHLAGKVQKGNVNFKHAFETVLHLPAKQCAGVLAVQLTHSLQTERWKTKNTESTNR